MSFESDDNSSNNSAASSTTPYLPHPPPNSRMSSRPPVPSNNNTSDAIKYKREAERWQEQYDRQLILHQKDISQLEDRLIRLELALKEAQKEKNNLSSSVIAKEKELAELARKHMLLKNNLTISTIQMEKVEKSSSNLAEKATRSTLLERKITDLEKSTAKTRSLVDAKTTTLEKLQTERKELRDLSERLQQQVSDLLAEKSLHEAAFAEAEAARTLLSARIAELESSVDNTRGGLETRILEFQLRCEELSSAKLEAESRLESVSRALDSTTQEWRNDKDRLQILEAEYDDKVEQLKLLQDEKYLIISEKNRIETHVEQLQADFTAAAESVVALENEKGEVEALLADMESKNLSVAELLNRLETTVEEKTEHIANLEQLRSTEHAEYEDVIESLKSALVKLQTKSEEEIRTHQAQNAELRTMLETGMNEILSRDAQIEELSAREEELHSSLVETRTELNATADIAETWRAHYDDLKKIRNELTERVESLEDELEVTNGQLEFAATNLRTSLARIMELESELSKLNVALDEASEALAAANAKHADAIAFNESRMEELKEELEQERVYRAGEKDMAELRIATIQASTVETLQQKADIVVSLEKIVESLKRDIAEKTRELETQAGTFRQEISQIKYELAEQVELVGEYRERAYDNELAAEESSSKIEELNRKIKANTATHADNLNEMQAACKKIIEEFRGNIEVLETSKKELEQQLKDAIYHNETHERERRGSINQFEELNNKRDALEARIGILTAALEQSQTVAAESQNIITILKASELKKEETISSLEFEISSTKSMLAQMNQTNQDLQNTLSKTSNSLNATISELNSRIYTLEQSIELERSSSANFAHQLGLKTSELDELVSAHEQQVLTFENELKNVRITASQLQSELNSVRSKHTEANLRIEHLSDSITKEVDLHAETRSLSTSLETQLNSERKARIELQRSLDAEVSTCRELTNQISELVDAKKLLEQQREQLYAALELEKELHLSSIQQLESSLSIERNAAEAEHRRSKDLSATLEIHVSEISKLKGIIATVQSSLEAEKLLFADSQEKINDLCARFALEKASLDQTNIVVQDLENVLMKEREAHAMSVKTVNELSETLANERGNNLESVTRLNLKVAEMNTKLEYSTVQVASLENQRNQNLESLALLNLKVAEIKNELELSTAQATSLEKLLADEKHAHALALRDTEDRHAQYVTYHDKTKQSIEMLVAALDKEKSIAKEKDDRVVILGSELAEKTAELESEKMEVDKLKATEESFGKEREAHRESVTELQSRIEKLTKTLTEKDNIVKDLQTEVSAVKLRHANEVGRRDEEIRTLNEKMRGVEAEFLAMKVSAKSTHIATEKLDATQAHYESMTKIAKENEEKLTQSLIVSANEIHDLKSENERLQGDLVATERKLSEVEETLSSQVDFLSEHYKAAFEDIKKLTTANADLMGHQNASQKIRHVAKMKADLMKMKEEYSTLIRERDMLRRKNIGLERDLEAYKAVVPVSSGSMHATEYKYSATVSANGESDGTKTEGAVGRKMSRIGRTVLAARAAKQQGENSLDKGNVVAAAAEDSLLVDAGNENLEN
ncbi:hypothetical protein HK100_002098, partial [Physocladia obscura]